MNYTVIRVIRIVLVLLALALLIWFIIWIFSPKGSDTTEPENTSTTSDVQEYYSMVRYVQDGQITAPEEHHSIVITITSGSRRIEIYKGYSNSPMKIQDYSNSQDSYDAFFAAIRNVGFFAKRDDPTNASITSYCPLGTRYSYIAGDDLAVPSFETWSASCSAKAGTFNGNKSQVKTLFKNQIPDYTTLTKDVSL